MRGTHSTFYKKALESSHTCVHEWEQFRCVSGYDAAVEADVNPALTLRRGDLLFEAGDCGRGWDGIQWHIYHGRNTAGRSGLGAGFETLPFCSAGLVQVDMSVDETW